MNWFFIVGCPRSGTTMLQQALNRHPQVIIPPETAFFTFLGRSFRQQQVHFRRIQHDLGIDLAVPTRRVAGRAAGRSLFEAIAEAYMNQSGRRGVTHFGEKSPEHLRRFRRIRALFAEAKLVLVYRDGRDVALSLSRVPWMPPDLHIGFALWRHYARVARRAAAVYGSNLRLVRYEDVARDPERELEAVCQFLGLDYVPEVALGSGNDAGVPQWERPWKGRATEAITNSRVGTWNAELSAEQVAILERWGGHDLESLGYQLVTEASAPPSALFYAQVYWRVARWLLTRPAFGDVNYSQPEPARSHAVIAQGNDGDRGRTQ